MVVGVLLTWEDSLCEEILPEHVRLLDRREHDTKALVTTVGDWITTAPAHPFNVHRILSEPVEMLIELEVEAS